jgi:transcriptional regulator with XRE-family HTH domain
MSKTDSITDLSVGVSLPQSAKFATRDTPLHRIRKVRSQENISLRVVARHLGTGMADAKFQERATTDLPLSVLYKWQEALAVPVSELLVEPDDCLSAPMLRRAQLVRVMKTAVTILERAKQVPLQRMAKVLVSQLIDIMPELRDVSSWHLVGKRRARDEYGRAVERCMPDSMFTERPE